MGVVVAAHHLQLDERVALKFLLPEALGNAEAVGRFSREARAAVKIKSEHVARVTDVGTMDNGSPYMVMEYLQGNDLSEFVHTHGALPIADAVEYVLQACEALAEAHALGIVHRDLKPANLFLTERADHSACVKVLDFGISKVTSGRDSEMSMTRTATVMGSPLYMSPEQMASARDVDTRTDIWAIGAILHELLTGRVPFAADTMPQLCAKILQEEPPRLRDGRPDAPPGLDEVVRRCLQKDPSLRYPSVAELAAELLPFGPSRGRVSVERITKVISAAGLSDSNLKLPSSSAPAAAITAGTTQQAWGAASQAGRTGGVRWLAVGAAAVFVVGGVVTAFALGMSGTDAPIGSAPAASPVSSELAQAQPPPAASVAPVSDEQAQTSDAVAPSEGAETQPSISSEPVTRPPKAAAKAVVAAPRSPLTKAKPVSPSKPGLQPAKTTKKTAVPAVDLYQDRK
jgi:serine/threonine-protein kinase